MFHKMPFKTLNKNKSRANSSKAYKIFKNDSEIYYDFLNVSTFIVTEEDES